MTNSSACLSWHGRLVRWATCLSLILWLPQLALALPEGVPNALALPGGIVVGGQPSEGWLAEAAAEGFTYIVDLRGTSEDRGFDEPHVVGELGMVYVAIPVSGLEGLSQANAERLDEVLSQHRQAGGKILVHCASGNRVGALFSLRSFYADGASLEEAIAAGKEAGLTRLEGSVREALEDSSEIAGESVP